MEVSKMGLTILKHLKEKGDSFILNKKDSNSNVTGAMCHYNEIKELFPKYAFSKVTYELISLMDQKLIHVNLVKNPFSFPDSEELLLSVKFGLAGKGYALLENRFYKQMSKYIPLTLSAASVVIALLNVIFNNISK